MCVSLIRILTQILQRLVEKLKYNVYFGAEKISELMHNLKDNILKDKNCISMQF